MHFYFHFGDESAGRDKVGRDLESIASAKSVAIQMASALVSQTDATPFFDGTGVRITVTDSEKRICFTILASGFDAPMYYGANENVQPAFTAS